jgi:hypothetical protein
MSCAAGRPYIVQPGDTLVMIAQRLLGDGSRWPDIKNADGTSPDPEDLQPGQELCVPDNSTVMVYEDADFQGQNAMLTVGQYDWGHLGIANDTLSSLRVGPNVAATLYADTHFRGPSKTFSEDVGYVGDDFNDITSSIVVGVADNPPP